MRKLSWNSLLVRSSRKTRLTGRMLALLSLLAFICVCKQYLAAFYTCGAVSTPHLEQVETSARQPLQVHYLDVGFGDSILVQCNGHNCLIDGGYEEMAPKVIACLEERGVQHLDAIVCSHDHGDHVGGLLDVYRRFGADKVYASPYVCQRYAGITKQECCISECDELDSIVRSSDSDSPDVGSISADCDANRGRQPLLHLVKELRQHNQELVPLTVGATLSLGKAHFDVLGPVDYEPSAKDEPENNHSLVMRLVFGKHSWLFTGDIQKDQERALLARYGSRVLKSDVLKVAHHGSGTSSTQPFLRAVWPKCSVISVRPDQHGLPHQSVEERLHSYSDRVYRTDERGCVTVHSDGKRLTYSTER